MLQSSLCRLFVEACSGYDFMGGWLTPSTLDSIGIFFFLIGVVIAYVIIADSAHKTFVKTFTRRLSKQEENVDPNL